MTKALGHISRPDQRKLRHGNSQSRRERHVRHYANMREPRILAVLARMVPGVVSLNYFMPYPCPSTRGPRLGLSGVQTSVNSHRPGGNGTLIILMIPSGGTLLGS